MHVIDSGLAGWLLLERAFAGDRVISFQGDEQDESHQLELLAAEAGRVLLGRDALRFGTWDAALSFLGEQARTAPLTIILDEFQWLKHAQPALDSVIQRHWDRWDREELPVTLVLAGSALTLMEQLLERGAPLFGRATARPRLEPLDYRDAAGFAADKDPEALLRRWAVLGGTPQYQVWAGDGPLDDVITSRILSKDSALYDEPRHLLREGEGIRDPGTYLSILRAVANGATQHNEIAQQAKATSASLALPVHRRAARLQQNRQNGHPRPARHDSGSLSPLEGGQRSAIITHPAQTPDGRRSAARPAQLRAECTVSELSPHLFHVRDANGRHEIDILVELGDGRVIGIEVKADSAPGPDAARHLRWLRDALGSRFALGLVLHTGPRAFRLDESIAAMPVCALWG